MNNKTLTKKCMAFLFEPLIHYIARKEFERLQRDIEPLIPGPLVHYIPGEEFKGLQKDIDALDVHSPDYREKVRDILGKFEREDNRFLNYLIGPIN